MKLNRDFFYNQVRATLDNKLTQAQVDGMNRMLERAERGDVADLNALGYVFATAWHETGGRMVPVREGFAETDAGARAAVTNLFRRGVISYDYGRPNDAGLSFYGRGLVQLTHEPNYRRMGRILKIPLAQNPDLALDPKTSVDILFEGMIRGSFCTGHLLIRYFGPNRCDRRGARRIINGTDKAELVAAYSARFTNAFRVI